MPDERGCPGPTEHIGYERFREYYNITMLNIVALCRLPTPTHDTVVGTENSTTSFSRTTLGHRVLRAQNKLIDGMMHANLLFSDTCFVSRDLLSFDFFFIKS